LATGLLTAGVMFEQFQLPLGLGELFKRTLKETLADDVLSLAAQQAYFFFFALFPALLAVISIASFFPIDTLMNDVIGLMARVAPPDVIDILRGQLLQIADSNAGGLLTFAFLVTIWSSSSAVVSMVTTLNAAYDITEGRPWWKVRVVAIGLTLGIAVFILASMVLIVAGPALAANVASSIGLGPAFTTAWAVMQWPVVFLLVSTGIGMLYHFAPDAEQHWVWITPGAILATLLWIIISLVFKFYVAQFGNYNETYGAIGGVMVLLLWLYLSGVAVLTGAELNAEIEHASPHEKTAGERVPGEKRKIGVAAKRDYEKRKARGEVVALPFPDDVNCDIDRELPRGERAVRASDLIIGAAVLLPATVKIARKIRNDVA